VSFAKLSDLLAAVPRPIVNNMARGVYLIGSKLAQRVRAVQIVDCAGNSTTLRLMDYYSAKMISLPRCVVALVRKGWIGLLPKLEPLGANQTEFAN
jgi:hypothetical protein